MGDGREFTVGDIASAFITSWPNLDGDLDHLILFVPFLVLFLGTLWFKELCGVEGNVMSGLLNTVSLGLVISLGGHTYLLQISIFVYKVLLKFYYKIIVSYFTILFC